MARKRIDLTRAQRFPSDRQAIWQAIRKQRTFTVMSIEDKTRINPATIRSYLTSLTRAGYLVRIPGEQRVKDRRGRFSLQRESRWELTRDVGVDAPRVTRDGKEVTQGRGRDAMWRAMKMLKQFNYRELAAYASTGDHAIREIEARDYCRFLHYAGYLSVKSAHVNGHKKGAGQLTVYRFIASRNTGPYAPMIQRIKAVFDPNLNEVVYTHQPGMRS